MVRGSACATVSRGQEEEEALPDEECLVTLDRAGQRREAVVIRCRPCLSQTGGLCSGRSSRGGLADGRRARDPGGARCRCRRASSCPEAPGFRLHRTPHLGQPALPPWWATEKGRARGLRHNSQAVPEASPAVGHAHRLHQGRSQAARPASRDGAVVGGAPRQLGWEKGGALERGRKAPWGAGVLEAPGHRCGTLGPEWGLWKTKTSTGRNREVSAQGPGATGPLPRAPKRASTQTSCPIEKPTQKWIKHVLTCKTLKLLETTLGGNLEEVSLDVTPKAETAEETQTRGFLESARRHRATGAEGAGRVPRGDSPPKDSSLPRAQNCQNPSVQKRTVRGSGTGGRRGQACHRAGDAGGRGARGDDAHRPQPTGRRGRKPRGESLPADRSG